MAQQPDPRETRILADMRALVLEEQPGAAATALETLRKRARRDAVSGGALKNVFASLMAQGTPRDANPDGLSAAAQNRIAGLSRDLRRSQSWNAELQARLDRATMNHDILQSRLSALGAQGPTRATIIATAFCAGLLLGVAGTQLVHSLRDTAPASNLPYLHP